jgi:hypothetical protein
MKAVAQLQQFLSALIDPLKVAGASEKTCNELQQVAGFLEPFKEKSLAELGEMLRMIDEYQRTKQWPEPAVKKPSSRKPAISKAPKLTVPEATQSVLSLLERVNDPNLEYAAIDAEMKSLEPMTKGDLLKVAQGVGMTIAARSTKPAILEEIRRRVRDRKGSFDRTQFRADASAGDVSTQGNRSEGSEFRDSGAFQAGQK